MAFRVLRVMPIEHVAGIGGKKDYDAACLDIHVYWHSDDGEINDVRRWTPAADKIDGLIKISDALQAKFGDAALTNHDVTVAVEERKNPKSGNWYHVYHYTCDQVPGVGSEAPAAAAPPAAARPAGPPAPPAAARPAGPPVAADADTFIRLADFGNATDVADLRTRLERVYPGAVAAGHGPAVLARYQLSKESQLATMLRRSATVEALDANWAIAYPAAEKDPAMLERLGVVYNDTLGTFAPVPF